MVTKKRTRRKRVKYLIMISGEITCSIITENILNAARRGLITKAGLDKSLVPDRRGEFRDKYGKRFAGFGSVKRTDCTQLSSFCPLGKSTEPTPSVSEKDDSRPQETRAVDPQDRIKVGRSAKAHLRPLQGPNGSSQ